MALVQGETDDADLELAARLTARFGQGRDAATVSVEIGQPTGASRVIEVEPLRVGEVPRDWYL